MKSIYSASPWHVAFCFLIFSQAIALADATYLDQLATSYERAVARHTEQFEAKASPLKTRYRETLDSILKFYQAGGDIDGAISVKKEVARLSEMTVLGEPVLEESGYERLDEARAIFERSAAPIREDFAAQLASLTETRNTTLKRRITEATKSGDLESAVAMKEKLDEWLAEKKYSPKDPPSTPEEVIACLTDTTWSYVGETGRDQYMRFYPGEQVMTMWQEDLGRTFGMLDYRVTADLDVIWAWAGEDIRMEFDDEFLNYKCYKDKTDQLHRVGKFIHRGPGLLPE